MKKNSAKPRVLMVDDDADFQAIVAGWLGARYQIDFLSNGEGLLDLLESLEPDLLILDVRMPGLDGFQLCGRVRSNESFSGLPILFLTGCKEDEDFLANLDAGGTAFLAKPVERKELLAMVGELIEKVSA